MEILTATVRSLAREINDMSRTEKVEGTEVETFEPRTVWHRPAQYHPPFNDRILVVLGSWNDRGRGFKPEYTVLTVKVMQEDVDGSEDAGEEMAAELNSGDAKWKDLQFRMVDSDDEELDWYSDSIMWWTNVPMFPDERQPIRES